MILYHGTHQADKIRAEGFKPVESQYTQATEPGIFFSNSWDFARQHGEVITVNVPDEIVELYQENPLSPEDWGYVEGDEYIVSWENVSQVKILH